MASAGGWLTRSSPRRARAQLWTHAGNERAQRLYERRGFGRSGREKLDDAGETIVHYEVGL